MSAPNELDVGRELHRHMRALQPNWKTKEIGAEFKPDNTAWQRGTWMPTKPATVAVGEGVYARQYGIFQIDFFYPKSERRVDTLKQRGIDMLRHFFPANGLGLAIAAGGGKLVIEEYPFLSEVDENSDPAYNHVHLDVVVRIELTPAT